MRTFTAYAAAPLVRQPGLGISTLTLLHADSNSAARANPTSAAITRITYRVPEDAHFSAFAVDGRKLDSGDDPAEVLAAASEADTIGAGVLISVRLTDTPDTTSRVVLALHHAVFGNLEATKSMAEYIVTVEPIHGGRLAA